jgi:glycosyltransferase involved in cell wall biosynthesis
LWRRAAVERNRWRRAYVRRQAQLREDLERYWCERIALNVVVSDRDRASLERIAPRSRITIVPNGVDIDRFQPAAMMGQGILAVGGLHWLPNLDALDFFCRDILPHLRAAEVQVPVRWIGGASIAESRHYHEKFGVEVTGYVDDVRPFMREAACHIVPLRTGGGTRLKILTSWAMGKPIVPTSIGCEGVAAVDGDNILIRDEPREFAKAVLTVLADPTFGRRWVSAVG